METELLIDVRAIAIRERHPRIFAAFEALAQDRSLVVISDHEPRPLHAQFQHLYPGRFVWEQREFGDGRWEIRLKRTDAPSGAGIAGVLNGSPLFAPIGDEARSQLAFRARRTIVRRHRALVETGVLWPYCGLMEEGIVTAVLTTPEGRDRSLYDVLPGEIFGEIALLDRGFEALRYVATTATATVVLLPSEVLRSLIERDREFAGRIEVVLAQRFRTLLDRMAATLAHTATARVAMALLPYAPPEDGLAAALAPLPSLTHAEIALAAGTVKEVVSRALAKLEELGALVRRGGRVVELSRSKLAAAAEERPEK